MKRTLYFVMALALVLGLSQCKKEQPLEPTNEGNGVRITLNLENGNGNGAKAEVVPPHVNFVEGDTILVASDGKYVGYLVHNGTTFSGGITDPTAGQPLYFYFLGNKIKVSTLTAGTTNECTVNISDQTGYPALPVISMAPSEETYPSNGNVYTASLHNKCSLMKFTVKTPSVAPISITGMNNQVTVNFAQADSEENNNGFTYSKINDGLIKMKGGTGNNTPEAYWAIVLPQGACDAGTATSIGYTGTRPAIHEISMNQYYSAGIDNVIVATEDQSKTVDFSNMRDNFEIPDGYRVTGHTQASKKISIADGATVVFDNVTIPTDKKQKWAGVTCNGDATIFLKGDNSVTGSMKTYPGIFIGSGYTLTIQGTGSLTAQCSHSIGTAAGIGGGSSQSSCGNIIILGGTVTATGYGNFAGIGSGGSNNPSCGNITIANTVTQVTATCGSSTTVAIGNPNGTCGTVTFGTQVMYDGTSWTTTTTPPTDGNYGGLNLAITNSNRWTLTPANQ